MVRKLSLTQIPNQNCKMFKFMEFSPVFHFCSEYSVITCNSYKIPYGNKKSRKNMMGSSRSTIKMNRKSSDHSSSPESEKIQKRKSIIVRNSKSKSFSRVTDCQAVFACSHIKFDIFSQRPNCQHLNSIKRNNRKNQII